MMVGAEFTWGGTTAQQRCLVFGLLKGENKISQNGGSSCDIVIQVVPCVSQETEPH